MKNIKLKVYITFQFLLMLVIANVYILYVYPQIKEGCSPITKCSRALSCDCENESCVCQYYDDKYNVKEVKCPNRFND